MLNHETLEKIGGEVIVKAIKAQICLGHMYGGENLHLC